VPGMHTKKMGFFNTFLVLWCKIMMNDWRDFFGIYLAEVASLSDDPWSKD